MLRTPGTLRVMAGDAPDAVAAHVARYPSILLSLRVLDFDYAALRSYFL